MTRIGFRLALAYRSNIIMTCVALVAQVFLLRMIWTSVYGSRPVAAGLTLEALLAYLALANLQAFATHTIVSSTIHHRIRTGMVFFDLARPVGYLRQMAAFQVGNTLGGLLLLAPVIPVVLLVGSITVPVNGAGYVITLVLGYVIAVQLALLISLIGFWTMETGAISLLYRLVSQFFAGTMVPLAFFPGVLGVVAEVLPFKYMGYVPAAIYVGHISDISGPVVIELAWIAGLWGLLVLTWSRAHRKVVIQGG
ncbi:ABC-2 type transport system permease protein [Nonomuraea polychroma]|uniref:ABC-2 type transport system permease protein n=1 Tax=Nonomuraea polychroma TaxID=46176 RepID=A0A438MNS6_9ACTN|nr:ABC-2 family transporter protein [Nonomuraea polychroma]RVX47448.1 ABC-2 type transport system permease protein [Nonomuraea polychroma]